MTHTRHLLKTLPLGTGLVGLALAGVGCSSSSFCETAADAAAPAGFYADVTGKTGLLLPDPLSVTKNGPITSAVLVEGSLPAGMTLAADGTISGTPTVPGVYLPKIRITNGLGGTTIVPARITVEDALALGLNYATPQVFPVGTAIKEQVPGLDRATPGLPITYQLTKGTLPEGVTLNTATGILSGIPTKPGVSAFTIQATNGTRTASTALTYTVTPAEALGLSYAPPAPLTVGTSLPALPPTLTQATPGVPTTYSCTTLPNGLVMDPATGIITGIPTVAGVFAIEATAVNGTRSAKAPVTFTVMPVEALTVAYATPLTFPVGTGIPSQSAVVDHATPGLPTTFRLVQGTLPDGLSLDAQTGVLSGLPTAAGVSTFTIQATNGIRTASATATYTITPAEALGLSYAPASPFTVGTAISDQLPTLAHATPGVPTTYASTPLPGGLVMDPATGIITGIPTVAGVFNVDVTATNGTRTARTTVTLTVMPVEALNIAYATPVYFPKGVKIATQSSTESHLTPGVGKAYAATGLPTGLVIDPATGAITGTPSVEGPFTPAIRLTHGTRTAQATPSYVVESALPLALTYPAKVTVPAGSLFPTQTPTLTGATQGVPSSYKATGLPTGLTIDAASGVITGSTATPGVYSVAITVTNGSRTATSQPTYTIEVTQPLALSYTPTLTAKTGTAFSGGQPTPSFETLGVKTTYTATGLPTGMALDPNTGIISGQTSADGIYTVIVTATNGTRTAQASTTLTVNPAVNLGLTYPASVSVPVNGTLPVVTPTVVGATTGAPSAYSATGLPSGLQIDPATGVISGSPSQSGTFPVTVTLTNGGRTTTATTTVTVEVATPLSLTYTPTLTAKAGTPFSGGQPTPSFETSGVKTTYTATGLPTGLTLDPNTGIISGQTSADGIYTVTITATNGTRTAQATSTLTVNPAADLAVSYPKSTALTAGQTLPPQQPIVTGATSGATSLYSATGLPNGTSIDPATGVISGTPSQPGTYTITVTLTNGGRTTTTTTTVLVNEVAPTALGYQHRTVTAGGSDVQTPSPTGHITAWTFVDASNAPLSSPQGCFTIDPATGVITCTNPQGGPFTLRIKGSNSSGSVVQEITYTVVAAPLIASFEANPTRVASGRASSLTPLFTGTQGVITGPGMAPITVQSGGSVPTPILMSDGAQERTYTFILTVQNAAGATITQEAKVVAVPATAVKDVFDVTIPSTGDPTPKEQTDPTSTLYGTKLTVPAQGACGDLQITVLQEKLSDFTASEPLATLPVAANGLQVVQVSEIYTLASNLGYPFSVPVQLGIPVDAGKATAANLATNELVVPFYWDPTYKKWVAAGLKGFEAFGTGGNRALMTTLLPGRYVLLAVKGLAAMTAAPSTLPTAFKLADDFKYSAANDSLAQGNQGDYDVPGGASLGIAAFQGWYYGLRRTAPQAPASQSALGALIPAGSSSTALVSRLANGTLGSWRTIWNQGSYALTAQQTAQALLTGLHVTRGPQLLVMNSAPSSGYTATASSILVTAFDPTTQTFTVTDPNYPKDPVTLAWTGTAFGTYTRAAGYIPKPTLFAFEGQPTVHRMSDYELLLNGATSGWPTPPFASIDIQSVAGWNGVVTPGSTILIPNTPGTTTVNGAVTNGSEQANYLLVSQNGGQRQKVSITSGTFQTGLPLVDGSGNPVAWDPYGTTFFFETAPTPCDPTFRYSGFTSFTLKLATLPKFFQNLCFETGTLQAGATAGTATLDGGWQLASYVYSTNPTKDANTGVFTEGVKDTAKSNTLATKRTMGLSGLVLDADDSFFNNLYANGKPFSLRNTVAGARALRINSSESGSVFGFGTSAAPVSEAVQVAVVPNVDGANPRFTFNWAAALEDFGHAANQQPFVDVRVEVLNTDGTVNKILLNEHFYAGQPDYTGWIIPTDANGVVVKNGPSGNAPLKVIPWQRTTVNGLAPYKGMKVRLTIKAGGCTPTGHCGYAYVDAATCE